MRQDTYCTERNFQGVQVFVDFVGASSMKIKHLAICIQTEWYYKISHILQPKKISCLSAHQGHSQDLLNGGSIYTLVL